ncbi:MAG: hypothetical protein ACM3KR_03950 [Deltaproteobacteria bacterium]
MKSIVIDGHDFSGKTILAKAISETYKDSQYLRPFDNSIGDLFWWCFTKKNYEIANKLAESSIEKCKEKYEEKLIIFDRHWVTLFSILPEEYWASWYPLPITIICWANPEVTDLRMRKAQENELYYGYNQYYCEVYRAIAEKFGTYFIDTSYKTEEQVYFQAIECINKELGVI